VKSPTISCQVAAYPSGNIVGRINEVTRRWAGLVLRWVTVRGYTVFVFNQVTQANSAWPSLRERIGVMRNGDGYSHRLVEFCVTRTAGILAQSVKVAGC